MFENEVVYAYNPLNLVISYAVAVAMSALAGVAGLLAAYSNGVIHANSFSTLVATTRNRTLDALFAGESLGAVPVSRNILDRKLRFGRLMRRDRGSGEDVSNETDTDLHTAFGQDSEISALS